MVKQKHHTCRNKSYKEHRQGIKKVQRNRYVNTKGVRCSFGCLRFVAGVGAAVPPLHRSPPFPLTTSLHTTRIPCTFADGPEVPQVPAVLTARLC